MASGQPLPDSVPAALARGSSIGRYIVLAMVGRGGMGEVYAAYDPELDRKVAVKLLRVKPGNGVSLAEGRQRTLREAQAIARLSHPNVVVAFDVGTFEDKVFIAMEYVEGNTVTYWLQVQQRTWKDILKVFVDAGRGLAAAHEKGLVHRDFKTDNVMISRDRHVRVMDFGLARQVQEKAPPAPAVAAVAAPEAAVAAKPIPISIRIIPTPASASAAAAAAFDDDGPPTMVVTTDPVAAASASTTAPPIPIEGRSSSGMFDARLTRTGAMMGTPAYMAPEQFLGTPTDARSDQFSFCIALYEALYRERPFEGSSMTTLTANVVHGNVKDAPAGSKVPLWVRRVLLRGLQPRARDRWPSMEAMIAALEKDPSVQRRKWLAAGGAIFLIGGLFLGSRFLLADQNQVCSGGPAKLAGIWDLQREDDPKPARHAQIRQAFLATGKSYAPDVFATVSRALTTYAQSWANMYKENCEATDLRHEQSAEVMDLRMECLQERLGGAKALTDVFSDATGEVVENAVSAANSLETLDRCADVPLLRAVLRPPEEAGVRLKVQDVRQRLAGAKARFDAGRWREALSEAPQIAEQARDSTYKPVMAEALAFLGTARYRSGDARGAEKALVEAALVADSSRHDEVRAEAAVNLVYVVGYQGARFDEAQRWAEVADSVLQRLGGHDLLRAWLFNDLGAVYHLQGESEAALKASRQSLLLKERVLGHSHPDVGLSEGNLALALSELGQNQDALEHMNRSISILSRGLGAGHPDLADQLSNRGEILRTLGRFPEARDSFDDARRIAEREIGPESAVLAEALTGIGLTFLAQGNPANALVSLERARRIREAATTTDLSKRAETNFALAKALWESGRDRARALALAEEARASYAKVAVRARHDEVQRWIAQR